MRFFILYLLLPIFSLAQSPNLKLNLVADGLSYVVDIASAGDNRLFIVDGNKIKILDNGQILPTPF